ncbi:MAG: DUF1223 domain-containing protein [Paracoccus sp. (in: a-proteobacteria)]
MTKLAGYFKASLLVLALCLFPTLSHAQGMGEEGPRDGGPAHSQKAGGKAAKPEHGQARPASDGRGADWKGGQAHRSGNEKKTGDRALAGSRQAQAQTRKDSVKGSGGYADIMDDVNSIIDAMDDRSKQAPPAPASGQGTRSAPSAAAAEQDATASQPPTANGLSARQAPPPPAVTPEAKHEASPIVVELFTSQGCAACPPAEALLADLVSNPGILAISWHVDYWDYLGWRDHFARPEFSARQEGYNQPRGARTLFTPQFFIAGEIAVDDLRPAHLMAAIKREKAEPPHIAVTHTRNGARNEIVLTPIGPLPATITVQLIRYLPKRVNDVRGGDNAGRKLAQHNIVVGNDILARWNGQAPLRLTITLGAGKAEDLPPDTRHVILVQHMNGGHPGEILATVRLD